MKKKRWMILRDAVELAMLYLPLFAVSWIAPGRRFFAVSAVSGILCFCVLFSESRGTALKKWALSVPFTLAFEIFLWFTDFPVRLANAMNPGYGRLSGGSGFAMIICLLSISAVQAAANTLAVIASCSTGRMHKPRFIIQNIILPVLCVVIFSAVLYLEFTMPTWETIYRSVYS